MKAICIKNYDELKSRTTIGKVYEIYKEHDSDDKLHEIGWVGSDEYFVADNGDELWYDSNYFISIEQHREQQLNKIGI